MKKKVLKEKLAKEREEISKVEKKTTINTKVATKKTSKNTTKKTTKKGK